MAKQLNLLPAPQRLEWTDGAFHLADRQLILLAAANPLDLRFSAQRFQDALRSRLGLDWETVASPATPPALIGLTLALEPQRVTRPEGYELDITPRGITICAHDPAGAFYAVCTLIQILTSYAPHPAPQLPGVHIRDWPDFPARGVMLDISRDRVPTQATLYSLVDQLAGWKINQLQLYTEHTFAYRRHPEVWAAASPLTGQEILDLDAYCRQRYIELVPNQNSFGHMTRWLQHPRYAGLAEVSGGYDMPWGHEEGSFSLCPVDPASLELLSGLFAELLPHFTSRMVNVGCDETFDIGQGRSREQCAAHGNGRVYLDFLLEIERLVKGHGRQMQFWGDIILKHPELIAKLPKDSIALEWGYEADHPFAEHGAQFAAAGLPFYVCPGTSSWMSIAGRTDNAVANLLSAAENGLRCGAAGYLITDWGDNGHWQPLPVSFLGFAVGAAVSWALEANRGLDVPQAVSWHAFQDPSGSMGRAAYDLGNVYLACQSEWPNASFLANTLLAPLERVRTFRGMKVDYYQHALRLIDQALQPLEQAHMERRDCDLILREYRLAGRMLRHAAQRGLLAFQGEPGRAASLAADLAADLPAVLAEYRSLWLERSRPGGLADSLARLEKAGCDYAPSFNYHPSALPASPPAAA